MSNCPSPDRLLRLLRDDPPEIDQTEVVAHLDSCRECRGALDRLAARSGLWHDLALLRDCPPGPSPGCGTKRLEVVPPDDEDIPVGLLEPPDQSGHLGKLDTYDVLRVIGRGGMGIVFLARDRTLDRLVAIKLLTPGMAATGAARRRFAREAKAAAAVVHEHVVTIHAVDTLPPGVPYLVMQYIAGKSVQELIDRGKAVELAEILRIGSQAAGALAAAHAQGLIHRDIKPANILLENGVERVKITDFGLARAVDDVTVSHPGAVGGTPQYMSPEQASGEPIDHRTDLFSLGSVLYALCTGQAPFRGNSSMATLKCVCEQTPRPIRAINPEIPSWLVKIIERLHAKDPADRYESAAHVADLLSRCLAHVQQAASAPLPAELLPVRNRRAIAVWGAFPVCLMLAGLLMFPGVRGAAGQAANYVATVLRLKTPEGTLVVETDDPSVGITLDGSELVITGAGVKELRLSVGQHSVQTVKGGRILRDELVTISRGGRTVLTVRREADNPAPAPLTAGAVVPPPVPVVPGDPGEEVHCLTEILRSHPPGPLNSSKGTKIFMRDLASGYSMMIADTSTTGLPFAEQPDWSHDGRRVLFRAKPTAQGPSRMIILEGREGRPHLRDVGAGDSARFSPDDRAIAFVLYPGEPSGEAEGVWLMNADGTNRRRLCELAAPFWSPDGAQILLNGMLSHTISKIYDFKTKRTTRIDVPGQSIFSWPRWVAPGQIVACIGGGVVPDSIVILDVNRPEEAKVVRRLWNRDAASDVFARWPLLTSPTGDLYFIGDELYTRTLYTLAQHVPGPGRLSALEVGGPKLSGLSLSPDHRYLLFASDWLGRDSSREAAESARNQSEPGVKRRAQKP
jgi:Protein kinase domain